MIQVRPERPNEVAALRTVNERAFGTAGEATLVEGLRARDKAAISLVAHDGDQVVGHILFSPVTVTSAPPSFRGVGLAPMSVVPERQHMGIGSLLVHAGLIACREAGYHAVVVLGHVHYYPRFGFVRAQDAGLDNEYGATDAFMVLELIPGGLTGVRGVVKFGPEFQEAAL